LTVLEVRTLGPAWLRAALMEEFGGTVQPDGSVTGAGWTVRVIPLPPVSLGRIQVRATRLEVAGAREAETVSFLTRKTMRGGG
jgi:hypothetical protein